MKQTISTDAAPAAVGAYSQATETDDLLFTAGQIPLTPDGDLLDEAGLAMDDVLKVNVYLDDIRDFDAMNDTYASFFDEDPPARSAVGVDALPKGVGVEVEAIAAK